VSNKIVLIGQSLGGALSLDYWVRQRGVNAVVTVSAPHVLKLSSRLLWELSALVCPAVYRALRYGNPLESLPAVGWFKRKRFPIRVDGKRNYLDVFTEALNQLDWVQRLRAVPSAVCPLLVVHGTRDGVIPVQQAKTLGEALGNRAKLKVFSALTHLDLLFTPAVIETIVGWVNQQFALTRSS
jgi:pimeloyl-ACP methyl ester carboxylesterase